MPFATKQSIIVPWDFSEMSREALTTAVSLAASPDQIEVVHVSAMPTVMEPVIVWDTISEASVRKNILESFRKDIPEEKYPGSRFVVLFGDPGTELADYAKQVNAGLIVISSHGRTGIKRFLLGSVAERVVRLAPCPVLVLRDDKR